MDEQVVLDRNNLKQLQDFVNDIAIYRGIKEYELDVDALMKNWLADFLRQKLPRIFHKRLQYPEHTTLLIATLLLEILTGYSKETTISPSMVKKQLEDLQLVLQNINYDL